LDPPVDSWAEFEGSKWLPKHGLERVLALLVYIVFLNVGIVVISVIAIVLLGDVGDAELFWPNRWW
jgi:hypothetical protein